MIIFPFDSASESAVLCLFRERSNAREEQKFQCVRNDWARVQVNRWGEEAKSLRKFNERESKRESKLRQSANWLVCDCQVNTFRASFNHWW